MSAEFPCCEHCPVPDEAGHTVSCPRCAEPDRPASIYQPFTFGDADMAELRQVRLEPVSEDEDRW